VQALVENPELEKIYRERLAKMRREGVLLGIKAKPYSPKGNPGPAPEGPDGTGGSAPGGEGAP
jgi:hypothetical protein